MPLRERRLKIYKDAAAYLAEHPQFRSGFCDLLANKMGYSAFYGMAYWPEIDKYEPSEMAYGCYWFASGDEIRIAILLIVINEMENELR